MLCSSCGKNVPFVGAVCPYCQRDKSKDQAETGVTAFFCLIGGALGYFFFGFRGAFFGLCLGGIVAAVVLLNSGKRPPAVQVVRPPTTSSLADESPENKLVLLKQLHEQGLLTAEEFANKKAEILAKF